MNAARLLRFGSVWVNDHIPLVSEMPHGGFKQSGYGKDMSAYALEDYTEIKHVMVSPKERTGDAGSHEKRAAHRRKAAQWCVTTTQATIASCSVEAAERP